MTKKNQTAGQTALKYAALVELADSNLLISPKGEKYFSSKEAAEAAIKGHQDMGAEDFAIVPVYGENEVLLRTALKDWIGAEEETFECVYKENFVRVFAPFTLIENIAVGVGGEKRCLEYRKYIKRNGWELTWLKEELTNDIVDAVEGLIENLK